MIGYMINPAIECARYDVMFVAPARDRKITFIAICNKFKTLFKRIR